MTFDLTDVADPNGGRRLLDVTFYGVRGSTPCSCNATSGVGGNTSCVLLQAPGDEPIVLDLGTGLRYLGNDMCVDETTHFGGTALVTHLHWDHIQGIPFFVPLLRPDAKLRLIGPEQHGSDLASEIKSFIRPPLFPVDLQLLPCDIDFIEMNEGSIEIGSSLVTVTSVPHVGPTNAYRIDNGSGSVVYMPDHQQPIDGSLDVPDSVVEFCHGADLLIHDAQYDESEFERKATWGHSTVRYAVEVARRSEVARLALFHHDPAHDDVWIHDALKLARCAAGPGLEVFAAAEGLHLRSGAAD